MKLFVTGITGHTGGYFLKKLSKENFKGQVICVVRKDSHTQILDNSKLNIKKVIGDLNDVSFLASEMKKSDLILHIASIYHSKNVIKAARIAGINDAILVHTTGMFSRFKSASKEYIEIENEILSNNKDMNITILRPTMIYGSSKDRNMVKLIDYLNTHKFFPIFGRGRNLMQPVHASDLGNAYYAVIENWWDLLSDTGHQISSGTYWVKLQADVLQENSNTIERLSTLAKFVVIR